MLPSKPRYPIYVVDKMQKRVLRSELAMRKARKLCEKAERELAKTRAKLKTATQRYREAKESLDIIGVSPAMRGFVVDEEGYVVPKRQKG